MASEQKNSSKLKSLNWILWLAIGLLLISIILYFAFIFGLEDNEKANWGTFGDLIGGTLNPIFALFSLFAIIYTIKIQTEELELSRQELNETKEELKESRIAQQKQSESLQIQNQATKLQTFENTFFQLTEVFTNIKQNISICPTQVSTFISGGQWFVLNKKDYEIQSIIFDEKDISYSNQAIEKYLAILKNCYNKNYDVFNNEFELYTGTYFSQIYQVLKFIDESEIINKQRYVNIFRAQFTKAELELLFYHCLGSIGINEFKPLIEKYEFFEHITHNEDIDKSINDYTISAFGKNEKLKEKHKDYTKS